MNGSMLSFMQKYFGASNTKPFVQVFIEDAAGMGTAGYQVTVGPVTTFCPISTNKPEPSTGQVMTACFISGDFATGTMVTAHPLTATLPPLTAVLN